MTKTAYSLFATLLIMLLPALAQASGKDDLTQRDRAFLNASFKAQAEKYAPATGEETPPSLIVVSPQYYYTSHGSLSTRLGGVDLKSGGGHSSGVGVVFSAAKPVSEMFTVSFFYQFIAADYDGGMLVPKNEPGIDKGTTDESAIEQVVGFVGDWNFKEYGRLNFSLLQAFEQYDGTETMYFTGGGRQKRSTDELKVRITSLMAWYEKDFLINESWSLTPYAGWRALYVVVKGQNDWGRAPGHTTGDSLWAHLASGGLKLNYIDGPLGLTMRAGFNYRVSKDDLPGFGSRAVAPGMAHLGYRNNFDRTIGTWGLGFNYATQTGPVVAVNYDGFAGADTQAHMGSLTLVFPW